MAVRLLMALALTVLWPAAAATEASIAANEIEQLIGAVGKSDCHFVRNGKEHDAEAAEAHLRLKYRRGRRYATSAEKFIDRLASKSSLSRKPYLMKCPNEAAIASGDWLHARLAEFRAARAEAGQ
ncbi:MAG: DUF5329 domain-containing protein [Pseudomonadota bacterium]